LIARFIFENKAGPGTPGPFENLSSCEDRDEAEDDGYQHPDTMNLTHPKERERADELVPLFRGTPHGRPEHRQWRPLAALPFPEPSLLRL
jgi:hypothetical protein